MRHCKIEVFLGGAIDFAKCTQCFKTRVAGLICVANCDHSKLLRRQSARQPANPLFYRLNRHRSTEMLATLKYAQPRNGTCVLWLARFWCPSQKAQRISSVQLGFYSVSAWLCLKHFEKRCLLICWFCALFVWRSLCPPAPAHRMLIALLLRLKSAAVPNWVGPICALQVLQ